MYVIGQRAKGSDLPKIDAFLRKKYSLTQNQLDKQKESILSKQRVFYTILLEDHFGELF